MRRFLPPLQGLAAAFATLGIAALLPASQRLDLLALVLALTAGIYMGFGFLDGRPLQKALEVAVGLAFLAAALVGAQGRPLVLAGAWVAHVAWDLAHHPRRGVTTEIARWVPPFCLVYDLAIAAAIVLWWW